MIDVLELWGAWNCDIPARYNPTRTSQHNN